MTPLRTEKSRRKLTVGCIFMFIGERLSDNQFSLDIFSQRFGGDVQVQMITQLRKEACFEEIDSGLELVFAFIC